MPKVYYFNLDDDYERREFMESQYKKYNIDYERVSQSCYTSENFDNWIERFEDSEFMKTFISPKGGFIYPANLLRHLDFMKEWLVTSNEKYLLIMEDDYDLGLIDYWHFNWDYLMSKLPVDWDGIRLNDDNNYYIKFYLHPIPSVGFCNFGTMLYKREFVRKIVKLYCYDNGIVKSWEKRLIKKFPDHKAIEYYNVDMMLTSIGKQYSIPIFTTEASFCIDDGGNSSKTVFGKIQRACHHWWRNERDLFTLEDFFTYDKPYDERMTIYLNNQIV